MEIKPSDLQYYYKEMIIQVYYYFQGVAYAVFFHI